MENEKTHAMMIQVPVEVYEQIKAAAVANMRTAGNEAVIRIVQSFKGKGAANDNSSR